MVPTPRVLMCVGVVALEGDTGFPHKSMNHEKWMPSFACIMTVLTYNVECRLYAKSPV